MKSFTFFIPGPLPGMNEIIDAARGKKMAAARQKEIWTVRVGNYVDLKMNQTGFKGFPGSVFSSYLWQEPNRRRDPGNIISGMKFVEDGMVKAGLITGDGWKQIAGFQHKWIVDKKNPGVIVTVTSVEGREKA